MAGAAAKARLEGLSKQLVEGIPDESNFENLPGIRHVAEMPPGERVKGKVIIITGMEEQVFAGSREMLIFFAQDVILRWVSAVRLPTSMRTTLRKRYISATMQTTI